MRKAAGPAPTPTPIICRFMLLLHKQIRCSASRKSAVHDSGIGQFGRRMKFGPQPLREQARRAVADRLAVDAHDRHDDVGRRGDESLAGSLGLFDRERPLDELDGFSRFSRSIRVVRVTPRRMALSIWRVMRRPCLVDDPGVGRGAFRDVALRRRRTRPPWRPRSRAASLASAAGSSITVLMSQRAPARIGHGLDGDARLRPPPRAARARRCAQGRRRSAARRRTGNRKSRGPAPRETCR